jgi:hypothetical protein
LEAAREELEVSAHDQVIDPEKARPSESHWKHQAERYGEPAPERRSVANSQLRKEQEEGPRDWLVTSLGFTVRLLWAAVHLVLFFAVIALLALLALFVLYLPGP